MARKTPTPITGRLNTTMLIQTVAADLDDLTEAEVKEVVYAVFGVISRAAAAGHDTAITNFGTFLSRRAARRKARNPQTGGTVIVASHQVIRFRPSDRLVEAVRRRARATATITKLPKTRRTAEDVQP